jgi:phosphoribosylformylglycinamidine synthase
VRNIAGIANERFSVAGLMPHPDRAVEGLLGSEDGRAILSGMIASLESRQKAAA